MSGKSYTAERHPEGSEGGSAVVGAEVGALQLGGSTFAACESAWRARRRGSHLAFFPKNKRCVCARLPWRCRGLRPPQYPDRGGDLGNTRFEPPHKVTRIDQNFAQIRKFHTMGRFRRFFSGCAAGSAMASCLVSSISGFLPLRSARAFQQLLTCDLLSGSVTAKRTATTGTFATLSSAIRRIGLFSS